jgi:hypothetical protein
MDPQHPQRNQFVDCAIKRPLRRPGETRRLTVPVRAPSASLRVHNGRAVPEQFHDEQQRHTATGSRWHFVGHPVGQFHLSTSAGTAG